jgi:glycosyltransferase involved in cell wall biosynthesis
MTTLPTFSIVIPTYKRPDPLGACLEALAALDYPPDRFEVIVVDDGSRTPAVGPSQGVLYPIDVRLLTQPHAGPATARNTGAAQARGDYLAFTDDDCIPNADWLRALAARVVSTRDHAIGGRTINALPANPYSSATQLLIDYLYEWHAAHRGAAFFASNNLAVPAELFRARGGFHSRFSLAAAEDREFCWRWARSGGQMTYAPEAVVRHAHPLTLASYWRQHFTYGRGALHFHRLHAGFSDGREDPTPLSFSLGLVAFPISRTGVRRRLLQTLLMSLAQAATAAGYWRERLRPGPTPTASNLDQSRRE